MKKLLQEPFLHFLLLGAALFAINGWRRDQRSPEKTSPRIEITAGVIGRLSAGYTRQFGHLPDEMELRGLVNAYIREEVLCREAITMGLDREDTIVRQRMAQKMEFLTDNVINAVAPDDLALRAYFSQHPDRYAKPATISFRQIYFSREKRGPGLDAAAREGLTGLAQGANEEALGDPFLHGVEFARQEPREIAALFGNDFATRVAGLSEGQWMGPIASSYGVHLVRIETHGAARTAIFEEVREPVRRDFIQEQQATANRAVFEKLRAQYAITVDEAALSKAVGPADQTAQR